MTKQLPVTRGKVTTVSDCDYEWVAPLPLYGLKNPKSKTWYVSTRVDGKRALLHRLILARKLGRELQPNEDADHKDRNGLNNTRGNLRLATRAQNIWNTGPRDPRSGWKGVTKNGDGYWRASMKVNGQRIHLGYYDTALGGAIAYNHGALHYLGEFAFFNEIPNWMSIEPVRRNKHTSIQKNNSSGYPGVVWHKHSQKWAARPQVDGERTELGYFDKPEQAASLIKSFIKNRKALSNVSKNVR